MNLTFTHLKLLIQLYSTPIEALPCDYGTVYRLLEMEKLNLISSLHNKYYITGSGIQLVEHLGERANDWIKEQTK